MSNNPINQIGRIVEENKLSLSNKSGVSIVRVKDRDQGLNFAKIILYSLADRDTALFLSGGSTPKPLYQDLAREKKLEVGAVAMVDERFGPPFHPNSNEKMIRETGLIDYLASDCNVCTLGVKSHLHPRGEKLRETAEKYNKTVHGLFTRFKKRIAIMGIGEDGHIASLRAGIQNSIPDSLGDKIQNYAIGIKDFPGDFKERITLTFSALSKMDLLIVLVFGSSKKNALNLMLTQGSKEEVPARFYRRPDVANKTIVITDQRV